MKIIREYRKGVMFLRLYGNLTKKTYHKLEKDIKKLVEEESFNNIVINLSDIKKIDMKGISTLYYIYEIIKKYKGVLLLCLTYNEKIKTIMKKKRILNYIPDIDNELMAFDLIKI